MKTDHTLFVSEIGSNHNGDLNTAKKLIRASHQAGADAVKFQTLRRDKLVAPRIMADGKQVENPVYQNFSSFELPDDWHHEIKKEADQVGIEFFSTPFYLEAVDLLESVGVSTYKIASGDITFAPLLERVGQTGKRVILSTGASSLPDVDRAVGHLTKAGSGEITLLHCVSNYPPNWHEMNLRAIVTLREAFGLPVGISDHSPGDLVPLAAVALGATLVEKHVTIDRLLPGPDHPFAITVDELGEIVKKVRQLEEALGSGEKIPVEAELAKQHRLRRGVYDPATIDPVEDQNGIWLRPEHS